MFDRVRYVFSNIVPDGSVSYHNFIYLIIVITITIIMLIFVLTFNKYLNTPPVDTWYRAIIIANVSGGINTITVKQNNKCYILDKDVKKYINNFKSNKSVCDYKASMGE